MAARHYNGDRAGAPVGRDDRLETLSAH